MTHSNRGNALRNLERFDEAIEAYDHALDIDPQYAMANNNRGVILKNLGRLGEAIKAYDHALEINPQFAMAHNNRGNVLNNLEHFDEAIKAYTEAIKFDPTYPEAHCNLGLLYMTPKGNYTEALRLLERGHELGQERGNWPYPSAQWIQECRELLEQERRLDALLAGELVLSDPVEELALARVAYTRNLHVEAATLAESAFEREPTLAEEWQRGDRYNAACSALLASAGKEKGDDAIIDDQRRIIWRSKGIAWLKAEHDAWLRRLQDGSTDMAEEVIRWMNHWKSDPDLASIRGDEAIGQLPEETQVQCRAFWREVEELLDLAQDMASNEDDR